MRPDPLSEVLEEEVVEWRAAIAAQPDPSESLRLIADVAILLLRLGRLEEALAEVDGPLARHETAEDPDLRGAVRHLLAARAHVLRALGREEEANDVEAQVEARAGEGVPSPHSDETLRTMSARAKAMMENQEFRETLQVLADALAPYELDPLPEEQAALVMDVMLLLQLAAARAGDVDAAIRGYGEIVRRYASTADPNVRERVAEALWNSAHYVEHLGDSERAEVLRSQYHA